MTSRHTNLDIFCPLPPSSRFLVLRPYYYHYIILYLPPTPQIMTSFMDDLLAESVNQRENV